MPAGSTVWNQSHSQTHRHLGKLAVYIRIRSIEHLQSHQHLTQENCTSVLQHFKEQHLKNRIQILCIFHLLAISLSILLTSSSLDSFQNSEFIQSCTFLEYFGLVNMVILPSLLALIILSNAPCATLQDKNLNFGLL